MRSYIMMLLVLAGVIVPVPSGFCGPLSWLKSKVAQTRASKPSEAKIGQGLQEALRVGIDNTVRITGKENGFLNNEQIKITLPENIRKVETFLRSAGFGPQVDEFVLSMNRAAEKAAPAAASSFLRALAAMTFQDAGKIFNGGSTAATVYFKTKTYGPLLAEFRPIVAQSMQDYGVTKKFEDIMTKVRTIPFAKEYVRLDIDTYVASHALDGVFTVLGAQEAKIRTDPAARVTKLLQEVFQ
jgi:hypothetical protein